MTDRPPVSGEPRTTLREFAEWVADLTNDPAIFAEATRIIEAERASTGAALDVERLGFYDLLDVAEAILTKYPPSRLLCDHASPDLGPRTTAAVADLIRSARLAEQEGEGR